MDVARLLDYCRHTVPPASRSASVDSGLGGSRAFGEWHSTVIPAERAIRL